MKRAAAVLAIALVLGACADEPRSEPHAATFTEDVCTAISAWGRDIVAAANAFTDDTNRLSADGRRSRYLFAFDDQRRITDDLLARLAGAPTAGVENADAVRARLLAAIDDVEANIAAQKADAAAHVDFSFPGPRPDRLFAGTEKSLSLMLKPLDEVSRDEGVAALGGTCGR